jgi:uroporphyrinogen decarboxylase
MDADELRERYSQKTTFENVPVKPGEMSPRERFLNIMDFKKVDRIIDHEFGYWDNTLKRWHNEGLPAYVNTLCQADVFFGFDNWTKGVPVRTGIHPLFPVEIVEKGERHTVMYDSNHTKCQIFTDGTDTIPHYIDYPIKDRASYQAFKEKLQYKPAERFPADLARIGRQVKNRNYILETTAGSTAGWVRNWMGFEGICYGVYDQPELLDEIFADIGNLSSTIAQEMTKHMSLDLINYWEDIAFKTGPILPPDYFKAKCGPVIRRTMEIFRAAGTRFAYVDCDGDMRRLVPTWMDNGVNIMFPLEVNAGIHPETLRQIYPGIRMMGGFDKVMLLEGKDAIKKELKRLKPLVDEGGFIPHVDHRVQADVSYKNYLYYLEVKRDFFGIPNKVADTK